MAVALLAGLVASGPTRLPEPRRLPEPKVELRLSVDRSRITEDQEPRFHVVIRNVGRVPLRLLLPQDGSDLALRNPSVTWTSSRSETRPKMRGCGVLDEMKEAEFFTLVPGERREIGFGRVGPELALGLNVLSLTYEVVGDRPDLAPVFFPFMATPAEEREWTAHQAKIARLYAALTPIRATSNAVSLTVERSP